MRILAAVLLLGVQACTTSAQLPDTMWTRTFGGPAWDTCSDVVCTEDGGYLVIARTQSFGDGTTRMWLLLLDDNGDTVWTRMSTGPYRTWGTSGTQVPDDGFMILGGKATGNPDEYPVWLVRTNSIGDTLWTRNFWGLGEELGESIVRTSDGGFFIVASDSGSTADSDILVMKTDSFGAMVWFHTYGGSDLDFAFSGIETPDGGFAVGGSTRSYGAGSLDFWLLRLDANGDSIFSRTFGGPAWERCDAIVLADDGGFVLAGNTSSYGAGGDMWLVKAASNGDSLWSRYYGGSLGEAASSVVCTE